MRPEVVEEVRAVIAAVRERGDAAVREYEARFAVSHAETEVPEAALRLAYDNVYAVARASLTGEQQAVVINNLNVPKPDAGTPTLLALDSVETLFHEFGHALHGLFAAVRYPKLAGTNVPRDFVEFPSQVNEMWVLHPEVLRHYARHHRTGEPIPEETLTGLREASAHGQGYRTVEYLASTYLDLAWHGIEDPAELPGPRTVEQEALARDRGTGTCASSPASTSSGARRASTASGLAMSRWESTAGTRSRTSSGSTWSRPAMAALAIIGLRRIPNAGYSAPAAIGIPTTL